MSDDEQEYEAEASEAPKEELAEAKAAMLAAKKKAAEEADEKLREYEEQRALMREKEEEEIRQLKEKQELRRQEREKEEAEMEERRQEAEKARKEEEDARKAKQEEEKRKKEEAKAKKLQQMQMMTAGGGPNFVIPKKQEGEARAQKFGNIVQAKAEMGLTKEQKEEQKAAHVDKIRTNKPDFSSMSGSDLKAKLKEVHEQICKLEAEVYDLENREQRQDYDLKELNERQRQIARNKAKAKGLDPEEAANSPHPPKVQVASKYDRQIDRRNFSERKSIFEKQGAIPHFPNCPPPPQEMIKKVAEYSDEKKDEEEEEEQEEEEAGGEEEEEEAGEEEGEEEEEEEE